MPATSDARAGRAAFTHPGFVLFQVARFLIVAAVEMQAVAVGWQVYEITKRPLDLGYVGLAQFLPAILLFPISGHVSDRFERRNVLSACYAGYAVCFALLLALAQRGVPWKQAAPGDQACLRKMEPAGVTWPAIGSSADGRP